MISRILSFRVTIRTKMIVFSLCLLLIPSFIIGVTSYQVSKQEVNQLIEGKLKDNVNMAIQMIELLDQKVQSGQLHRQEAEEQIKQMLIGLLDNGKRELNHSVDLGKNGYFFIINN